MSAPVTPDSLLTEPQRLMLQILYDVFESAGSWPVFKYVESAAWEDAGSEPRDVYVELGQLGLVRPAFGPGERTRLRDGTEVALTVRGLAQVPDAERDVDRLLSCLRYLADRAGSFKPVDRSAAARLSVSSEEVAATLGLQSDDKAIVRLGTLLQQTSDLTGSFQRDPFDRTWTLTLRPEQARRYADVRSVEDYLRLAEPGPGPGPEPAGESPAQSVSDISPSSQGSSAASDMAVDGDRSRLHFSTGVTADLPTTEDLLGFAPLVNALHGLLNDRKTVLPLAIAITAPWGAGKSSVMSQLQAVLDEPPGRQGAGTRRSWATVRFDAWKYERGERLWAALAKAIYSQPQQSMTRLQRIRFRARLERRRRGWLATLGVLLWPCLVLGALVLAATEVNFSGVGTISAVAAGAAATLGTLTRYANGLLNPFKRAIDRHARRPDYESQLGFTADADRDIKMLTSLLAPDDAHGLAVFVDDLDRCSSAHLVEVVEAMNQIFNSAQDQRCVFVLGLDRDVVTTNINAAYATTVAQLVKDENPLGERFGLEFLAKLVQLSVSLPEPTPQALETLLEKITGNIRGPAASAAEESPADAEVAKLQERIQTVAGSTLASVADAAAQIGGGQASSAVVAEAARRELAERIGDSAEVAEAEFAALSYLERNPRQIKRFHNAFRLQLYVANEDDKVSFDFTASELIALAKWVVVRLRWPDLGNAIARDPRLLQAMEATANGEETISIGGAPGEQEQKRWLRRPGVREVLIDHDPARRLSALELKTFLRVA